MAANKIETTLKQAFREALITSGLCEDYDAETINIEIPKDTSRSDYSSNIAMRLTKVLHRNPREIATSIMEHFDKAASVEKMGMLECGS